MKFLRSNPIHGGQLESQIKKAIKKDIQVFYDQPYVIISDEFKRYEEALTQVIEAHVPDFLAPQWAAIRAERDRRLTASDWTQLADSQLTEAARVKWTAYRQALRDLPAKLEESGQTIAVEAVAWPKPPG